MLYIDASATHSDLMAILPYPVAPPKNPQQKAAEPKKVSAVFQSPFLS